MGKSRFQKSLMHHERPWSTFHKRTPEVTPIPNSPTRIRTTPELLRIPRPSQQAEFLWQTCARCGKTLARLQKKWCSGRCRQNAFFWADQLKRYDGWAKGAS